MLHIFAQENLLLVDLSNYGKGELDGDRLEDT